MKLWQKENTQTAELIEQFTVGRDKEFDLLLARHDVSGSIAHATMLGETGLMTAAESKKVTAALEEIGKEIDAGRFSIADGMEDVHSQIEWMLTERLGDIGKKIHSGRSRNDQVAVAVKLFLKAEIGSLKEEVNRHFHLLQQLSERFKDRLLPGYTHFQIAMPSSAGLWLGAYAESFVDDLELLAAAYHIVNKNPLGSGAGYGSSFPLNRRRTTELLRFESLNWNSVYAQMTRGKAEKVTAMAMAAIASTTGRLAMDVCLYVNQNFSFISFPAELTTGSSIMPHKKNPDVFELIRAHCNRIQSLPNELTLLLANLPSGYHRDLQLTKEILFPAIRQLLSCLRLSQVMLEQMEVKENILQEEKYRYLFSVEAVNELVNKGVPFRAAYKTIGDQIEKGTFTFDTSQKLHHTHEGSMGDLCTAEIAGLMQKVMAKFNP